MSRIARRGREERREKGNEQAVRDHKESKGDLSSKARTDSMKRGPKVCESMKCSKELDMLVRAYTRTSPRSVVEPAVMRKR
jgi:hypothetical protein